MRKSISEIITLANEETKTEDRIKVLHKYDSPALRTILKNCFDPREEFVLPEGKPPYTINEHFDQEDALYGEIRRLYLFKKGGNDNLKPLRREALFIQLLEMVTPGDAELLCLMKDKKVQTKWKRINKVVVKKAYPGLIEEPNKVNG